MGKSEGSMFSRLCQRELSGGPVNHRPFVQDFSCEGEAGGTILCNASTARAAPVFSLEYGSTYNKFLAAADEDGYVSVINTAKNLPSGLDDDVSSNRPVAQWTAHRNAIFDLSWANRDRWIYTASGDMSLGLWDTSYAYKITSFYGHSGSVKSVSVSPHAAEIFASGSCDGNLLIWDARVHATCNGAAHRNETTPIRHSVLRLYSPHPRPDAAVSWNRTPPLSGVPPTVTAVQFLGESSGHTIASGGLDGVVKFWDLRYVIKPTWTVSLPEDDVNVSMSKSIQGTNRNARLLHLADTPIQNFGKRTYAVTSLALRPDSSQLLVSLKGGHHVMYDVDRPEIGPVKWYGGHTVSSFYVKTSFSPDGSHFASGSSDDHVCIWQVDDDADSTSHGAGCCTAPYTLRGHDSEVTAVAWCPTDFCQLATTADDYTIKVWNIHRQQAAEKMEVPGGWVPQPRAEIILAAKPKNGTGTGTGTKIVMGERQEDYLGKENNSANKNDVDTSRMMIGRDTDNPLEAVTPEAAAAGAAVGCSRLATTAITTTLSGDGSRRREVPTSTGHKIRIANALRLSLMHKPKMKRRKQQTLAEALHAARASQAAREEKDLDATGGSKQQQRRPRSTGTSDEEDMDTSPGRQQDEVKTSGGDGGGGGGGNSNFSSPSVDENRQRIYEK
ncbi:hypothetical protein Ndes2526B_g08287 [Nannochloris sp. 'desiccata']